MLEFTTASSVEDLQGILNLQKRNLPANLSPEEIQSQGFVTVVHSFEQIKKLNDYEAHVIAKDEGRVVGYLLAMTEASQDDIPVLRQMFKEFNNTIYNHKKLSEYKYIVVGQVCLDKPYRGKGLLTEFYKFYKNHFKGKYEMAITEIDNANQRSLRAHYNAGFSDAKTYFSADNIEWVIVVWDWIQNNS